MIYENSPSTEERMAAKDIGDVVEQYAENLKLITLMRQQAQMLGDIDAAVAVDDSKAFQGLEVLNRTISQKIRDEAARKGMKLLSVQGLEKVVKGITSVEEVLEITAME